MGDARVKDCPHAQTENEPKGAGLMACAHTKTGWVSDTVFRCDDCNAPPDKIVADLRERLATAEKRLSEELAPLTSEEWSQLVALANGAPYPAKTPDACLLQGLQAWAKEEHGRVAMRRMLEEHNAVKERLSTAERERDEADALEIGRLRNEEDALRHQLRDVTRAWVMAKESERQLREENEKQAKRIAELDEEARYCHQKHINVANERDEARTALAAAEGRIQRLATGLAQSPRPDWVGDWACAECRPKSDMLVTGFQCAYHEALAALSPAPAKEETAASPIGGDPH